LGGFTQKYDYNVEYQSLDADKSIAYILKHDGKLIVDSPAYV